MKDKLIEKLKERVEYFYSIYHTYEARQLETAIAIIERLIPPELLETK